MSMVGAEIGVDPLPSRLDEWRRGMPLPFGVMLVGQTVLAETRLRAGPVEVALGKVVSADRTQGVEAQGTGFFAEAELRFTAPTAVLRLADWQGGRGYPSEWSRPVIRAGPCRIAPDSGLPCLGLERAEPCLSGPEDRTS